MGHIALTIWDSILPQKAIKGQAMSDFLADHPVSETLKLYDDLPDEIAEINLINAENHLEGGE